MKISGLLIQNRNILVYNENNFICTYKGKQINITTNHGLGEPIYNHLKRYSISVINMDTGMKDVDTYDDFHTMRDAIMNALRGANLLKL